MSLRPSSPLECNGWAPPRLARRRCTALCRLSLTSGARTRSCARGSTTCAVTPSPPRLTARAPRSPRQAPERAAAPAHSRRRCPSRPCAAARSCGACTRGCWKSTGSWRGSTRSRCSRRRAPRLPPIGRRRRACCLPFAPPHARTRARDAAGGHAALLPGPLRQLAARAGGEAACVRCRLRAGTLPSPHTRPAPRLGAHPRPRPPAPLRGAQIMQPRELELLRLRLTEELEGQHRERAQALGRLVGGAHPLRARSGFCLSVRGAFAGVERTTAYTRTRGGRARRWLLTPRRRRSCTPLSLPLLRRCSACGALGGAATLLTQRRA